ncbi:hypothetical protein F5884DRAFT_500109 [Xylogone sp. PMI_703]|nr:hypothetical protein F5884DRAFT_500109 [Xylogone sp. PMI_703]
MRAGLASIIRHSALPRTSAVLNRTGSHLTRKYQPFHVSNGPRRQDFGIRRASTASVAASEASSLVSRLRAIFWTTSAVISVVVLYEAGTDTRFSLHRWIVVPALRFIYPDAEDAHRAGTQSLKRLREFDLNPREKGDPDSRGDLQVEVIIALLLSSIQTFLLQSSGINYTTAAC